MFELSEMDKKSPGQRLSVWVEELTVPDEAWGFMINPKYPTGFVLCLETDGIREIRPADSRALDVEWERALTAEGKENTLPGSAGHAGIAHLNQGGKARRKELRSMLADIAEISPVPVPHDISEDELRLEAYYVYTQESCEGHDKLHWSMATRKLRRKRVHQERRQVGGTA